MSLQETYSNKNKTLDLVREAAAKMGITVTEYLILAIKEKKEKLSQEKPSNGIEDEGEIGMR